MKSLLLYLSLAVSLVAQTTIKPTTAENVAAVLPAAITEAGAAEVRTATGLVFDAKSYGAVGDGTTDDTAAFSAALAAAYAAGGGTVYFPVGVYRVDSQITIPNNGTGPTYQQPPITLKGIGTRWNGDLISGNLAAGGSVLDLRYSGATAKIVTLGSGTLRLEGISLADNGSSTTPFVLTTATTILTEDVTIQGNTTKSGSTCDQDGFILGGPDTFASAANTVTSAFRGWGTEIKGVKFSRIRRGILGQSACNGVLIANNIFDTLCGSDNTAAAIQIDATGDVADGNVIRGNLIECTHYVYGVRFTNSRFNMCSDNMFFDAGVGPFLASYLEEGTAAGNMAVGVFGERDKIGDIPSLVHGIANGGWQFGGNAGGPAISVRPDSYIPSAATDIMFGVYRGDLESTSPAQNVFKIAYNGTTTITGRDSEAPSLAISKSGLGNITYTHDSIIRSTGDLLLYPGNTTSSKVSIMRGIFVIKDYTTAGRPTASAAGVGATYYDTTVSKPVYSDGATWRDAAGTAVP